MISAYLRSSDVGIETTNIDPLSTKHVYICINLLSCPYLSLLWNAYVNVADTSMYVNK